MAKAKRLTNMANPTNTAPDKTQPEAPNSTRGIGSELSRLLYFNFQERRMAKLEKIWIEECEGQNRAIRVDWDNDRHQRVGIEGDSPESVARALKEAGSLVNAERAHGEI